MDLSTRIVNDIKSIDHLLITTKKEKYSKAIDINKDNWMEIARQQTIAFQNEHLDQITAISQDLLQNFEKLSETEREEVLTALEQTEYFQDLLRTAPDKESFRSSLLILVLQNLGSDTRDALLELDSIVKKAKSENIDYKEIVEELIPLADDTDKHGMGSMRDILKKIDD